jgi:hypothetical protein
MTNKIHINLGYYFPATFIFLGVIMLIIGLFLLLVNIIIGIVLILLSLVIFTARYRLEINLTNQSYHDYLWITGFKKGKKGQFESIECLYINKNKYRQTVNSRVSSMTKYGTEYNGYIKFDIDDVHIISSDHKSKVVQKLKKIRNKLNDNIILSTGIDINSSIMDCSEGEAKEIEQMHG